MKIRWFGKSGKIFLAAVLAFFLTAESVGMAAGANPFPPEEEFTFNLRFLWFPQAAQSRLRIRRISETRYRADLVAETKGFIGFLLAYRKNYYTSEMEYDPESGRLVPLRFTKVVVEGGLAKTTKSENDYEKDEHRWVVTENGEFEDKGSETIQQGVIYEDLLSAFSNLRNGAYGSLTRGRRITLTSQPYSRASREMPEEGEEEFAREFVIRIADNATEQEYRRLFERTNEEGRLILVNVANDFFGQNTGDVLVWLDKSLVPVAARVEDVFLFGDVSGELVNATVRRPKEVGQSLTRSAFKWVLWK